MRNRRPRCRCHDGARLLGATARHRCAGGTRACNGCSVSWATGRARARRRDASLSTAGTRCFAPRSRRIPSPHDSPMCSEKWASLTRDGRILPIPRGRAAVHRCSPTSAGVRRTRPASWRTALATARTFGTTSGCRRHQADGRRRTKPTMRRARSRSARQSVSAPRCTAPRRQLGLARRNRWRCGGPDVDSSRRRHHSASARASGVRRRGTRRHHDPQALRPRATISAT